MVIDPAALPCESTSATVTAAGRCRMKPTCPWTSKLSSDVGVAFQVGCDIPLGKSGFGLTLDAKKYLMTTNAHFYQGTTEALVTHHTLNPLLLSAGVSYRF